MKCEDWPNNALAQRLRVHEKRSISSFDSCLRSLVLAIGNAVETVRHNEDYNPIWLRRRARLIN